MTFLDRFRDPVSGLTHLAGALVGLVFLAHLLTRAVPSVPWSRTAMAVYGVTLVLLYLASATYHLLKVSDGTRAKLRRIDHSMVSTFIAGSYTPFCVIALNSTTGYVILATVWLLAVLGLLKSIYWLHAPRWVTAGIYVLMGWVIVFAVYPLSQALTPLALWLLVAGGVTYSLGALIYAIKWPDPWPSVFGFHEIWHLFVLAGSACHAVAVLNLS